MRHIQKIDRSAAALWASAFVITALVILQAGRLPGNTAMAGMANTGGSYTLTTARVGTGGKAEPNEILYVIDSRDQVLLVYEVEDARTSGVIARDGGSLINLFRAARP